METIHRQAPTRLPQNFTITSPRKGMETLHFPADHAATRTTLQLHRPERGWKLLTVTEIGEAFELYDRTTPKGDKKS
ncbi:MAG: hypothetical protein V7L31_20315 [Nostoc sp.]|uniref:hypothetical protein n=1 Tax=Nostoc sp. TaxID=1180 RepID=UPI002FF2E035